MHFIAGAGPVGRQIATHLIEKGEEVTLASRSGTGPKLTGVRRIAVDVTDAHALTAATHGADVIYNALNPAAYHRWPTMWPPMAHALLAAAENNEAVLATVGNLYPYGKPAGPMVEGMPDTPAESKGEVRAQMTRDAMERHAAGRIRYVEVRGSDYTGPGVGPNSHLTRLLPAALKGRGVRVIGSPDQPHTWTDVVDVAVALVTVAADPRGHGRIWHVPSAAPRTQRQALTDLLAAAGKPMVSMKSYPPALMKVLGLFWPQGRELAAMTFQFDAPFVMDSSAIQAEFGLHPTDWHESCAHTVAEHLDARKPARGGTMME